jgi:hypothetical protein
VKVLTASFVFGLFFLSAFPGCKKTADKQLQGVVEYELISCNSTEGFAYIIHYNKDNSIDSFMTVTLPETFKVPGKQIRFETRSVRDNDPKIFCTDDIIPLPELVVFNVTDL